MKLEKAYIKYLKNGEYDYTLSSEYFSFETEEEARAYITNNIERNVEYYFYENEEAFEHYDVIICNQVLGG
jgi:hypothetical protein